MCAVIWNIFLAYAGYFLCRIAYVVCNWSAMAVGAEGLDIWRAFCGSLVFDTSAICYTLGIYILLMLLPIKARDKGWYQTACKWLFVAVSSICIIANLADCIYFPWAQRRTTPATFVEFRNEHFGSILRIIAIGAVHNWYLTLSAAAIIFGTARLYKKPGPIRCRPAYALLCVLLVPAMYAGIRGGLTRQTRPVNIGNAMRYVNTPSQAAAILNTPFAFIRNISSQGYSKADYMPDAEIPSHYSAVHQPCPGIWSGPRKPNIFIIIAESLSQEFIGAYNDYPCHTPFIDSLCSVSLRPAEAFANGNKSIDALPSILSSVPRVEEHLFTSAYVNNNFCSVVSELGRQGYSSAFFHGASAGSMGFDAYGAAAGVQHFYSYQDYCEDKRFDGHRDFDGSWAIWDEDFLQFTALHAADMPEPFVSTVFTATSHHPFVIPDKYKQKFDIPGHPMYSCISYLDYSLQRFFATAATQPWFDNTIFVLTADHPSTVTERDAYLNDELGSYRVPLLIFDPGGALPRGVVPVSSQHIDIFPTLMGIVGSDSSYVAFGKDILSDSPENWAYVYKEIHLLRRSGRNLVFDGTAPVGTDTPDPADLAFLEAFIQDYKNRMLENEF